MWLSVVLECSRTLCVQHFVKGCEKTVYFYMPLSVSASLGLRSTTAVHNAENSSISDSAAAVLALFYSPPFFPVGKVGQFSFEPVLGIPSKLGLPCAVLCRRHARQGTYVPSDRQNGLGHGSKFWLVSWDSALVEETASIWLLLKATELVYSLGVKRLLREVF